MPSIKYKKKTYAGATFPVLEMTKAEYDALPESKKMDGTVYMITDDTGGWEAENASYDNTESGLTATNVQDALDEVMSNISSVVDTLINNVSRADYKEMSRDVVRAKEQTSVYGDVYLGPGLYIAFSQTTVDANYNGRAYCDYSGNGATVVDFVPPTMTASYNNNQVVQLIIVKSGTASLQRRYWDTQATAAKHIWQIHRIF